MTVFVEDGKVYTIALARNKDTDEINSAIFVRPTGDPALRRTEF